MGLYPEQSESAGAKTAISLMHTPGMSLPVYSLPETAIPGQFEVNGRGFVAGAKLYEVFANGTSNVLGTLNGPPLTPTQIFSCQTHLLIQSNGSLFIYCLTAFIDANNVAHSAGSFFAVDMTQFNGGSGSVLQIEFMDGYFFASIKNSNTFQVSQLEDGTSWSGLFIATISRFPDNIVSMKVDHEILWFMSGKNIIGYYDCGAGYPPFIPVEQLFLVDGCGATFGTVTIADTIGWIEANDRGWGKAKIMGNGVGQRVSTLAVELAWQKYPTIADAVSYAYQIDGHDFWQISFPSAFGGLGATWVYDFQTGLWHQEGFWIGGAAGFYGYGMHRSISHMFLFNKHLVGDWKTGNIYERSIDYYTDFGNVMRPWRRTPIISKENKWIYFPMIEFDIETGLGPMPPLLDGNQQPRDPQCMMAWSNNAAKTWSNTRYLNCGQAGDYDARVRSVMMGRARKRCYDWWATDPVPFRIADCYLEAYCEGQPIYEPSERYSEQLRKIS